MPSPLQFGESTNCPHQNLTTKTGTNMKNVINILLFGIAMLLFITNISIAKDNDVIHPEQAIIERILPGHAAQFIVELMPSDSTDWFEVASRDDKIVLRGNNGVSIASALYYYLTEYTHCQITWNGTNLNLPDVLPKISEPVHKKSPYEYRYYLNYCTFNYSMSWWNWERWEKEIDWMALHGINMPLALTGEEYVWNQL